MTDNIAILAHSLIDLGLIDGSYQPMMRLRKRWNKFNPKGFVKISPS
jgi:hypothetical protein